MGAARDSADWVLTTASAAWTGQDLLVWGSNGAGSEVIASLIPGKATSIPNVGDGRVDGTAQYCSALCREPGRHLGSSCTSRSYAGARRSPCNSFRCHSLSTSSSPLLATRSKPAATGLKESRCGPVLANACCFTPIADDTSAARCSVPHRHPRNLRPRDSRRSSSASLSGNRS